jgi:shikimate dehydrogenase
VLGVNLTIPHKETMAALCDELGPNGRLTGAVNAVRFDAGRLVGEMFDGVGLLIGQKQNGIEVAGRRALLLGAGGAARAVAFAYIKEGVSALRIANRSSARAEKLVADIKAAIPQADVGVASADPTDFDVVCNCTSLGLHVGDTIPLDVQKLQSGIDVVDIIAARDTELMEAARATGCKVMGGVPMAVGQLRAFATFFDPQRNS